MLNCRLKTRQEENMMKNKELGKILLFCLILILAGCGSPGKFVKTQSENLALFADHTISMVAEIAQGIELSR
jgi:hypothetical protein